MGATKETPVAASLKWSQGAEALTVLLHALTCL